MTQHAPWAKTVLVVEDEGLIRLLLADEFASLGFSVLEAARAEDAARLLGQGHAIDAVVTDVRMPGTMDGIALCRWMGEHAAGIPVLVTSGLDARDVAELANPAVFGVVAKPYRPSEVASEVARHLAVRRAPSAGPEAPPLDTAGA